MESNAPESNFGDYYLQIQALSETGKVNPTRDDQITDLMGDFAFLPLALGAALLLMMLAAIVDWHAKRSRYMRMAFKVAVLMIAIPIGLSAVNQPLSTLIKAGPDETPVQVIVGNVTSKSMTLWWQTKGPTTAAVKVWPKEKPDQARVMVESTAPGQNHQLEIGQLEPVTIYQVLILSEGKWYGEKGKPIGVQTDARGR